MFVWGGCVFKIDNKGLFDPPGVGSRQALVRLPLAEEDEEEVVSL